MLFLVLKFRILVLFLCIFVHLCVLDLYFLALVVSIFICLAFLHILVVVPQFDECLRVIDLLLSKSDITYLIVVLRLIA